MNFFEIFPESSLLSTVSKKTIKMIGHHSLLRDMMGQSYPIFAWSRAYHAFLYEHAFMTQTACAVGMRNAILRIFIFQYKHYSTNVNLR